MTELMLRPGLYARLDGAEYRVINKGGWALWSDQPAAGFTKSGGNGFIRAIAPGEELDTYRIAHRGTYRGIPVTLARSTDGRVMATTQDRRAVDAGFDALDRGEWVKLLSRDDSDLHFTTSRTPEPGPWMTSGSRPGVSIGALRDTRADVNYFDEVVTHLDAFIATDDERLRRSAAQWRKPEQLGFAAGDAMRSHWSRFTARYSQGADRDAMRSVFQSVLTAAERALRIEKETFSPERVLARFRRGGDIDGYRQRLWLVSIALAMGVDDRTFARAAAAVERSWGDRLLDRLIASRQPRHPKGTWGWDSHETLSKKLYYGYWAFEVVGVVASLRIDDALFRNNEYYPGDLLGAP